MVYIDKLRDTVSGSPWGANTFQTAIRWKADDSFDWSQVYDYTQTGVILGFTDYGASLITNDPNFELIIPSVINDPYYVEEHTALEDVLIEKEILAYCYRQHKKMRRKLWE